MADTEIIAQAKQLAASQKGSRQPQALVRCKGFRCAAYQDKDGIWRSAADDSELEVLEVILRF
ncbi:MAG TPA: hypothetical protein VKY92_04400 [Verrucomicrobiae bacterium]|jgi:hypothetical protein|nr:hypothetical protein [Verrucomicrobiae bacterium]